MAPNPRKKDAPDDKTHVFWKPSVHANAAEPLIVGKTALRKFTLEEAPPSNTTFRWEHQVALADHLKERTGDSGKLTTDMAITPNLEGEVVHKVFVHAEHAEESLSKLVAQSTVNTPAPEFHVERIRSRPIPGRFPAEQAEHRGDLPVVDEFQDGEDLVVLVRAVNILLETDMAAISSATLTNADQRVLPDRSHVELLLRPRTTGPLGQLSVTPYGRSYVVQGLPDLKIKPMQDIHDFGAVPATRDVGRPKNVAIAVDQYLAALKGTLSQRDVEIVTVLEQSRELDPPPSKITMKDIVLGAFKVALTAVTAGVGAHLVRGMSNDGIQEFAKMVVEESLNGAVVAGLSALENEVKNDGNTPMGISARFVKAYRSAIAAEKEYVEGSKSRQVSLAEEAERAFPQGGMEMMMKLSKETLASRATELQTQRSAATEGYIKLLGLESLNGWRTMGQKNRGEQPPTSEQPAVIDQATAQYYQYNKSEDLRANPYFLSPTSVQGLLRLELVNKAGASKYDLEVKTAAIAGVNDGMRSTIAGHDVGTLNIPMIAKHEGADLWTIGKDANGTVSAGEEGKHLEARTSIGDPVEAARAIFLSLGNLPKPSNA